MKVVVEKKKKKKIRGEICRESRRKVYKPWWFFLTCPLFFSRLSFEWTRLSFCSRTSSPTERVAVPLKILTYILRKPWFHFQVFAVSKVKTTNETIHVARLVASCSLFKLTARPMTL